MTQREYLKKFHREAMPLWLENYMKGEPLKLTDGFLSSRIVYYPGSGVDGHPVEVFGASHSAHCFVYADYMLELDEVRQSLRHDWIRGYTILSERALGEGEVRAAIPYRHQHVTADEIRSAQEAYRTSARAGEDRHRVKPYAWFVIFSRKAGYDEDLGPKRLAMLFLGADAHATYDALFGNGNAPDLFGFLLQDHGFGGNYSVFGSGGLSERIAERTGVKPVFILGADGRCGTSAWRGYELVPGIDGNDAEFTRRLFRRVVGAS